MVEPGLIRRPMKTQVANYSMSPKMALDETLLSACIAAAPLFLLTIAGWISAILFITAALSIYILVHDHLKGSRLIPEYVSSRWTGLLMIALALPITAIFLGQFCRHSFAWPNYDSPSRLLISIVILLAVLHRRIDMGQLLEYSIPAAILLTFGIVFLHPSVVSTTWQADRMTTKFSDPLIFGSINFMFALLCLVSADFKKDSWLISAYKLLGFTLGIYLSVRSGSRTGWAALPFVLLLWVQFRAFRYKWLASAFAIGVVIVCSLAMYHYIPVIHERIHLAISEVEFYNWNGLNKDTSLGMRISFWRMALFLFGQNPLGGWGDTGFASMINAPEISRFASLFTREFPLHAGFHNEIMTNMVRSGVWGLISSIAIFLIPAAFFIKPLFSDAIPGRTRKLALLASCIIICEFISGMSTEVLNLKYTASFYTLMVSSMAGALLKTRKLDTNKG